MIYAMFSPPFIISQTNSTTYFIKININIKKEGRPKPSFFKKRFNYASSGAPTGHTPTQAPHSMQVSASITAASPSREIAPTGHSSTHAPQPMQASEIL
jgi:hypothetical protein